LQFKRLDFVSLKMDSYDKNLFTQDILSYSKNSMLFFYDFQEIRLEYKPDHVKWFPATIKFPFLKNHALSNLLLPFLWIIFFVTFLLLATIICVLYRPKVCLTENIWVGAVFGVARKIGLCKTFICVSSDWLANQGRKGFLSRLANNYLFVYMDYIAITTCDLVDSQSKLVNEARERYWGRQLSRTIYHRHPPPVAVSPYAISDTRTNICFLGQVREDSGLDLILPLLPELHRDIGAKLKIIGPSSIERTRIEETVKSLGLKNFVELHGFLPLSELEEAMKDCFCGINLIKDEESFTCLAVCGKFIQYLQMKMPILATKNNGIIDVIEENNLGIIIEPSASLILTSIHNLYKDQKNYITNIIKYAEKNPYLSIKDFLKIIEDEKKTVS
jgi:glycosyltransferase involved in cell wall biosynthesis